MKVLILLAICGVALGYKKVSVSNQDEATQLMDEILKYMKENPQFDSAPLPDVQIRFSRQFLVKSYKGIISLKDGRISGIGTNPHRHGKSTISKSGDNTYVRVSTHLMNMEVVYKNVNLQQVAGGVLPPDDVQRFGGQIKDISAIMTIRIDKEGALQFEDLDVKKIKETGFKFYGEGQTQVVDSLAENVIGQVKSHAIEAISNKMEEAVQEYQKQL